MLRRGLVGVVMAAASIVVAIPAVAQNPTVFERILVPVTVGQVHGAYGSVWSTELWYRNNSGHSVAIFPVAVSDWSPRIGFTDPLPIGNLPAAAPGQILFVSRDCGDRVQFDLRLFNRAAPQASWGTKLPVVRESEFIPSVDLINVPTSADFRSALRIYAMPDDAAVGDILDVSVYSRSETLLATAELTFEGWPRYASILSLMDALPEIGQSDRVRIILSRATRKVESGLSLRWYRTRHRKCPS